MSNTAKIILHFVAMIFSVVGLILLITFAAKIGTAWHIVAFSIFGTSLILLYMISGIYHLIPHEHTSKSIFGRIDKAMLYFLIAGTYTPMMLIPLQDALGITAVSIIWALAFIGLALYIIFPNLSWWVTAIIFTAIIALDATTFSPVKASIPESGFLWLMTGSIFYGLGILVFGTGHLSLSQYIHRLKKYDIGHYFIIAGSAAHFILMFNYILFL